MSENKYRAWDPNEDEYISWEQLIRTRYNQDYFKMNGQGDVILSMMTDKHIDLELFTGLIDQKNNQWCEGDILGALEPEDGSRCIIMRDEVGFYRQGIRTDYQIRLEKQDIDYWVKIGTHRENPDLLNAVDPDK